MIYVKTIDIISTGYPGADVLSDMPTIQCSDVNLLVGNQGSGKSTLLKMLQTNSKCLKLNFDDVVKTKGIDTFYFNSETDNPRIKDPELFTRLNGEDIGIGFAGALVSRFKSHGEILEQFVIDPLLSAKDCCIFLDEPESGLSLQNQFKLIDAINTAVSNGCQLFIATHCYSLIQTFNVISLEHRKQMSGQEFIELCINQIK